MKLSAIIVSYNVRYYLAQCIDSLKKAGSDIDMEIIVVDNASSDGTKDFIQQMFPNDWGNKLKFIPNNKNVGFGQANNQALKLATGEFILYVNPDTLVAENTLMDCLSFYAGHPEAGAVGVRMLHPNGLFALESRRGNPAPLTSLWKVLGLTRRFPQSKTFGKYYLQYLNDKEICKVDIVSGAFMMVPHELLNQTGAFDEDFFMYGEDIDLSYRIKQSGKQNYYIPARILHYKGESTNKTSRRYVNIFYEAMVIFFKKHYSKINLLYLPIHFAIYFLALTALFKQSVKKLAAKTHSARNEKLIYHFYVGPQSVETAKQLNQAFHLNGEITICQQQSHSVPFESGSDNKKCYYFNIYDMDLFSISKILNTFDDAKKKNCFIGTFYSRQKTFITHEQAYHL